MNSAIITYGLVGAVSLGTAILASSILRKKTQEEPKSVDDRPFQQIIKDVYVRISRKQNMALVGKLCELGCREEAKILEPYLYTLNMGGKKMRLIMAVMVAEMFTGAGIEGKIPKEVIQVGGLIESLHSASLMIDDIQDGSLQRRGQACSYLAYGLDRAINAANCIYFLPFWKVYESIANMQKKVEILKIYIQEMTVCHLGQAQDVMVHKIKSSAELPSLSEYQTLTIAKTSSLLRMMIKMLCVFLDRSAKESQQLCQVMDYVGLAFQVTDDVLNLTKNLGKGQLAEDLKEKKFTPIINQMRNNHQFIELFAQDKKDDQTIRKMLNMIMESDVLTKTKKLAETYEQKAEQLMKAVKTPYSKRNFERLMKFIITRQN